MRSARGVQKRMKSMKGNNGRQKCETNMKDNNGRQKCETNMKKKQITRMEGPTGNAKKMREK